MREIQRVEVKGVTRLFGATTALRAVNLCLEAGSLTFLEGPNGAGKSTLLAILGTTLLPTSGEVVYAPLGSDPVRARRHIGWLAHESHCYKELSGRQNVELAARLHGMDPREAWARASERLGTQSFGDRSFGTLSRGQRQRIALVRALVHGPSVLLLDEPWSGLDRSSAERLEAVVEEERAAGAIVVVVNHTLGLAERLGARTARLEGGRLVE